MYVSILAVFTFIAVDHLIISNIGSDKNALAATSEQKEIREGPTTTSEQKKTTTTSKLYERKRLCTLFGWQSALFLVGADTENDARGPTQNA